MFSLENTWNEFVTRRAPHQRTFENNVKCTFKYQHFNYTPSRQGWHKRTRPKHTHSILWKTLEKIQAAFLGEIHYLYIFFLTCYIFQKSLPCIIFCSQVSFDYIYIYKKKELIIFVFTSISIKCIKITYL